MSVQHEPRLWQGLWEKPGRGVGLEAVDLHFESVLCRRREDQRSTSGRHDPIHLHVRNARRFDQILDRRTSVEGNLEGLLPPRTGKKVVQVAVEAEAKTRHTPIKPLGARAVEFSRASAVALPTVSRVGIKVQTGTTLKFDRFWKWLREHPNCILRAGTEEVWLFDHEELHWHLEEDPNRNPVVQLIAGKRVYAELVMEDRDVLFVQATPEGTGGDQATMFELITGAEGGTFAAYHFLMAHPFEEEQQAHAAGLKH